MLFTNPYKQIVFRVSSFWVNECLSGAAGHTFSLSRGKLLFISKYWCSELWESEPGPRPPRVTESCIITLVTRARVWMGLLSPHSHVSCQHMSLDVTLLVNTINVAITPRQSAVSQDHVSKHKTRALSQVLALCLKISDQSSHHGVEIVTGAGYHYRHSI